MSQFSLYLHIPFCIHKCSYCSFFVIPENIINNEKLIMNNDIQDLKQQYLEAMKSEIRNSPIRNRKLYTLYIGWGTPYQLWEERLLELLHFINEQFDLSELQECTIEINPDPLDRVPQFMKQVELSCPFLHGLRRSIGIQSFDDSLLAVSKRAYTFLQLQEFFSILQWQKSPAIRYNADLIAFGKLYDGLPWWPEHINWFETVLQAKLFDSISLYTLELFPGSDWYHQSHHTSRAIQQVYGNDDKIFEEFLYLRSLVYRYGYERQELSNFALAGKGSLHNDVYWSMQSYWWVGINASSYLTHDDAQDFFGDRYTGAYGVRFQNTKKRKYYLSRKSKVESIKWFELYEELSREQYLKDSFFLGLRKQWWLLWIEKYAEILITSWREEITFLESLWKVIYDPITDCLKLTDDWFAVYNSVVNSLMK